MTKGRRSQEVHQTAGAPTSRRPPPLNAAHVPFLDGLAALLAAHVVTQVMGQSGPRLPRTHVDEPSTLTDAMDDEPSTSDGRQHEHADT